jgi:paraquat-inducible protein B
MSKKANPKLIGAFVLGAVALAIAGTLIFGGGKFFKKTTSYVLYFDGSIKGLRLGADVIFKGVKVGSVTKIKVVVNTDDLSFWTPVYIEVDPQAFTRVGEVKISEKMFEKATAEEKIDVFIERGLRAKLELQSFLTGLLLVSFDFYPQTPVHLVGLERDVLEIPTIPSEMAVLAKKLENLPIDELVSNANNAVKGLDEIIRSPEVKEAVVNLNGSLKEARKLLKDANGRMGPLVDELEKTLADARKLVNNVDGHVDPVMAEAQAALKQARETLASVDETIGEESPVRYQLYKSLAELENMARSLRALANYLETQPDAIVRGKTALGR